MLSRNGRAAVEYARHGFDVFPVRSGKAPCTEHGHLDATTDTPTVAGWWRRNPDASIAVRCTRFFVLDVDPRSNGSLQLDRWLSTLGPLPCTWQQQTGSQGRHYFFQHDDRLDAVPLGKLRAGIDIKGGGRGYVLVPPSRNKRGPYRWIAKPSGTPLARAPEWLIQLILDTKRRRVEPIQIDTARFRGERRFERALAYARHMDPAIDGSNGHATTMGAAVRIARGFALSEDEAYGVLAAEWNPRCQPPWSADDLRRKVREALRVGEMPMGALLDRRAAR